MISSISVRWRGLQDYLSCWQLMKDFTNSRTEETQDEIWFLEHSPVFTQGQNGKPEHILNPGSIPIVQTDRGGQITYHGPGQLMVYTLIDIKRKKLNIRELVSLLEKSIVDFLASMNIEAYAKSEAPGVYVNQQKICSIGLRIRRGFAYHGIAFNVVNELDPFSRINPCGFSNLKMTSLSEVLANQTLSTLEISKQLIGFLIKNLGYTTAIYDENN